MADDADSEPTRLIERLNQASPRVVGWTVFLLVLPVYLATASYGFPQNVDVMSNIATAAAIAETGSPVLDDAFGPWTEDPYRSGLGHFLEGPQGVVSKYPPGAALMGSLGYVVAGPTSEALEFATPNDPSAPSLSVPFPMPAPATAVAAMASAVAVALVAYTSASLLDPRWAAAWGLALGLGTSAWAVASDALWQHGVAMMWIAVGGALAARRRWVSSGAAYALAILTRPHTALVAAGTGLGGALDGKSWRPLVRLGLVAIGGVAALFLYSRRFFGRWGVSAGYESGLLEPVGWVGAIVLNYLAALFDPRVGLLVWSPFLLLALVGLRRPWGSLPGWVRGAFLGGVGYFVVQFALNRHLPDLLPYRYPLEAVFAGAPALALGFRDWCGRGKVHLWAGVVAVMVAVLGQAAFA